MNSRTKGLSQLAFCCEHHDWKRPGEENDYSILCVVTLGSHGKNWSRGHCGTQFSGLLSNLHPTTILIEPRPTLPRDGTTYSGLESHTSISDQDMSHRYVRRPSQRRQFFNWGSLSQVCQFHNQDQPWTWRTDLLQDPFRNGSSRAVVWSDRFWLNAFVLTIQLKRSDLNSPSVWIATQPIPWRLHCRHAWLRTHPFPEEQRAATISFTSASSLVLFCENAFKPCT